MSFFSKLFHRTRAILTLKGFERNPPMELREDIIWMQRTENKRINEMLVNGRYIAAKIGDCIVFPTNERAISRTPVILLEWDTSLNTYKHKKRALNNGDVFSEGKVTFIYTKL